MRDDQKLQVTLVGQTQRFLAMMQNQYREVLQQDLDDAFLVLFSIRHTSHASTTHRVLLQSCRCRT